MRVLAGEETARSTFAASPSSKNLRIGFYADDGFFPTARAIRRAVHEAATALSQGGAEVSEFQPPAIEEALRIYFGLFLTDGMRWMRQQLKGSQADWRVRRMVLGALVPDALRPLLKTLSELLGQRYVAKMTAWCPRHALSDVEYSQLVELQSEYRNRFLEKFNKRNLDAIICPPHGLPALRRGTFYGSYAGSYAVLYNLLGMPAGVVPVTRVMDGEESPREPGRDFVMRAARAVERGSVGLPIGVQVVSAPGRERTALAVMALLQETFQSVFLPGGVLSAALQNSTV
jgi:fatty acid amide hydrolase